MGVSFGRVWAIRVGRYDLSALDADFRVFRSTKREPNTATLTIYNLDDETRQGILTDAATRRPGRYVTPIEIRAGYEESGPDTIFVGDSRTIVPEIASNTTTLTIEARDGGDAYRTARINRTFAPGSTLRQVLLGVAEAMNVGRGNIDDYVATVELTNGMVEFPEGYTASGSVREVLSDLLVGARLRWSIQNNALQIQERRRPLQTSAPLLAPGTGLIGSPTVDERGNVTAEVLLRGGLEPGRKVQLESRFVSGGFEVMSFEFTGSTVANDWTVSLELRPY